MAQAEARRRRTPRVAAIAVGGALVALAVLEVMFGEDDPLRLGDAVVVRGTAIQIAFHASVGLLLLWAGWRGGEWGAVADRIFGVVFLALAVLGFVSTDLLGELLGYHVGAGLPGISGPLHPIAATLLVLAGFVAARPRTA